MEVEFISLDFLKEIVKNEGEGSVRDDVGSSKIMKEIDAFLGNIRMLARKGELQNF